MYGEYTNADLQCNANPHMLNMVEGGGFEPPKPKQQIYSLPPLTARESLQTWAAFCAKQSELSTNVNVDLQPLSCWPEVLKVIFNLG